MSVDTSRALAVILLALISLLITLILRRPNRLFSGGRHALPQKLDLVPLESDQVNEEASQLLGFLEGRLRGFGFERAGPISQALRPDRSKYRYLVVPFVQADEATVLLTAVETAAHARAELMLHFVTRMSGDRTVETSTLTGLGEIPPPPGVELVVVLDAGSVDEIWSLHRRALTRHARRERMPTAGADCIPLATATYAAWIQAAVRAQRLRLGKPGTYRIRTRPRSTV
ncbi:MAG: hypothetical protein IPK13_04370 [Deltaproteobacteria bacterium]|nr:hypothetical protein [Deltaproteobacteria bacterium]